MSNCFNNELEGNKILVYNLDANNEENLYVLKTY